MALDTIKNFLLKKGYQLDDDSLEKINACNNWYTNAEIEDFDKKEQANGDSYDLERLNFAKTICQDDANLVEVVEININSNEDVRSKILGVLEKNRFNVMYRKQTELCSALGTVACYPLVRNMEKSVITNEIKDIDIKLQYCSALNIIPLTVINDEIIEVAFWGKKVIKNDVIYTVVMFLFDNETKKYRCEVADIKQQSNLLLENYVVEMGEVKPFAIMRNASVNNLQMYGYGYPKIWNAIPTLKILDLNFTLWRRDIEKADKLVFINDSIMAKDSQGRLKPMSKSMKKIFAFIGKEKLPTMDTLYQEYNPSVRIDEVEKSMELALSMLSMSFGFGTRKYTFEQGRIVTATEYIGERQDAMQEVNKQRFESTQYIKEIINSIVYLYKLTMNQELKVEDINVDYDDSYIIDKESKLQRMKDDVLAFGNDTLKLWYYMDAYNLSEDEAKKLVANDPLNLTGEELEE